MLELIGFNNIQILLILVNKLLNYLFEEKNNKKSIWTKYVLYKIWQNYDTIYMTYVDKITTL